MNTVQLTGQIVERGPMRYTPAGLPALDVRVAHASSVQHEGESRQVSLEIHATAFGVLASQLALMAVGDTALFSGFLAKQRNGRGVMLHINALAPVAPVATSSITV